VSADQKRRNFYHGGTETRRKRSGDRVIARDWVIGKDQNSTADEHELGADGEKRGCRAVEMLFLSGLRFAARGSPPRHAKDARAGDPGLRRREEIFFLRYLAFRFAQSGLEAQTCSFARRKRASETCRAATNRPARAGLERGRGEQRSTPTRSLYADGHQMADHSGYERSNAKAVETIPLIVLSLRV
jgi:hypothetical protein